MKLWGRWRMWGSLPVNDGDDGRDKHGGRSCADHVGTQSPCQILGVPSRLAAAAHLVHCGPLGDNGEVRRWERSRLYSCQLELRWRPGSLQRVQCAVLHVGCFGRAQLGDNLRSCSGIRRVRFGLSSRCEVAELRDGAAKPGSKKMAGRAGDCEMMAKKIPCLPTLAPGVGLAWTTGYKRAALDDCREHFDDVMLSVCES